MRTVRIMNRGRIAPKSPVPIVDSGRTSWSSASRVSTIETQSPQPNLSEQVNQKLQETSMKSALQKKIYMGVLIGVSALAIVGLIVGLAVYFTRSPTQAVVAFNSTMSMITATTTTTVTTATVTTTTASTTTTTTAK